jgi:capsular polysaccharide biosynthesis protein
MDSAVDVVWLARSLWKRRAPIIAVFAAVLLGGLASSYRVQPHYRATAQITVAYPAGYYAVSPALRRELDLPQLGREAMAEHAARMCDPAWVAETLSEELGQHAAAQLAQSVRAVVSRREEPDAPMLSISVTADKPGPAAEAANILADTYVAQNQAWAPDYLEKAVSVIRAGRSETEARLAKAERELMGLSREGAGPEDTGVALVRAARITAADALRQEAEVECQQCRDQIAAALAPQIRDPEQRAMLVQKLAETALPDPLDQQVARLEHERAVQALKPAGRDWTLTKEGWAAPPPPEPPSLPPGALEQAAASHIKSLAAGAVLTGSRLSEVAKAWLSARTAALRIQAFRRVGSALRRQLQVGLLGDARAEPLLTGISEVRRDKEQMEEAETLFAGGSSAGGGADLVVSLRAALPSKPSPPDRARRAAFVLVAAVLASLVLGLALETLVPSTVKQTAEREGAKGNASDRRA